MQRESRSVKYFQDNLGCIPFDDFLGIGEVEQKNSKLNVTFFGNR